MVKLIKKIISMTGTTYSYLLDGSFDKKLIIVGMNLWKLMIYRAIFQPDWRRRKQKHPIANIVYPMVKPVLVVVQYWVYHVRNVGCCRTCWFISRTFLQIAHACCLSIKPTLLGCITVRLARTSLCLVSKAIDFFCIPISFHFYWRVLASIFI